MKYVSAQQACDHLRLDDPADPDLLAKITQASAMIAQYLGANAPTVEAPATGENPVSPVVQAATLLLVGYLYRYRDEDPGYELGYLPRPVVSILYPLRGPSCA